VDAVARIRRCGEEHGVAVEVDLAEEAADELVGRPEGAVQER
jgi:hypothetical protein